jgi:hypothetical protein
LPRETTEKTPDETELSSSPATPKARRLVAGTANYQRNLAMTSLEHAITLLESLRDGLNELTRGKPAASTPPANARHTPLIESVAGKTLHNWPAQQEIDSLADAAKRLRDAMLPRVEAAFNAGETGRVDDHGVLAGIIAQVDRWVRDPARDLETFRNGEIVVAQLKGIGERLQRVIGNPSADDAVADATAALDTLVALTDSLASGEKDGQVVASQLQYQESWNRKGNRNGVCALSDYANRFDAADARARNRLRGGNGAVSPSIGASATRSVRLVESSAGSYQRRFDEAAARAKAKPAITPQI